MTCRIAIVGCGSNKVVTSGPVAARDLYTSTYFRLKREYAELADVGLVLSAKYGLVHLDEAVETYERTMDDVDPEMWAAEVLGQLARKVEWKVVHQGVEDVEVEVLAGKDYVEPLRGLLGAGGAYTVRYPFDDTTGIGDQMGMLSAALGEATADA